jgi:hypothetical protein
MKYEQPYGTAADSPYVNGNPSTGTMGSIPPAAAIEYPQREIVNFITKAGLTPTDADLTQLAKAVQSGGVTFGLDTGSTNVLSAALSPVPDQYFQGMFVRILVANTNTGPASLNLNGLGAHNILMGGTTLVGGELTKNHIATLVYNAVGAVFEVVGGGSGGSGPPSGGGPVGGFAATRVLYIGSTMTVTAAANEIACNVRMWAGGGGGGGANGGGLSAGGGGGEYAEGFFNISSGISLPATVGAGGAPGAGTNGGAGGVTSFASLISCGGGQGGYYINAAGAMNVNIPGGAGGAGGGFRVPGGSSGCPMILGGGNIMEAQGGFSYAGGMSPLVFSASPSNGNVGVYPGGGGGGAFSNGNGGNGANGFIIVTMYAGV